jgi:hypothetical protein
MTLIFQASLVQNNPPRLSRHNGNVRRELVDHEAANQSASHKSIDPTLPTHYERRQTERFMRVQNCKTNHTVNSATMSCSSVEHSPRCVRDDFGQLSTKLTVPLHPREHRNVHFFVDELDRDLVEVIEYEKPPLWCLPDLYWSEQEKNEFLENARHHAINLAARYPQRVQCVEVAFLNCTEKDLSHEEHKEDMRSLLKWAKSSARGFEDSVSPLFWEIRKNYVRDMLNFFGFLMSGSEADQNFDHELRRFSECRTLRCREFAFKLAMADELIV